jgi:TolA-binding protein
MKHAFAGFVLSSVLLTGVLRGADAVTLAAQQEALENYKRLSATMDELQTTQVAQQKQISALASELSKLREDMARNNNSSSIQESLRQLEKQILKVDESRVSDNKEIQQAIERLGKAIKDMPAPPPMRAPTRTLNDPETSPGGSGRTAARQPGNLSNSPEEGFEYTIQPGDHHLGIIVKKYNDQKIPVTMKSIMNANPTVDWTRLKIGQKIFIPKPK